MNRRALARTRGAPVRHPWALRAGLLTLLVGSYLFFIPLAVQPFIEPKLLALNIGVALIWWSGLPMSRRPGRAAGILAGVLILAALTGVAPLDSLLGYRLTSTGLVLLLPCLFLIAVLPSLPEDILERVPAWLATLGVAMSAITLLMYMLPRVLRIWPDLQLTMSGTSVASTAGQPLVAVALLAVSLGAALTRLRDKDKLRLLVLGGIAVGLALFHETSSYMLAPIVVACWLWKARPARAIALQGIGVVALSFVLSFAATALPSNSGGSEDSRAAAGQQAPQPVYASSPLRQRITAWQVGIRAASDRPILGWGTDTGLSGYMANVTQKEAESQAPERSWWDVHNIFIQFLLTTGAAGLLALLYLLAETGPRAFAAAPDLAWAAAGVAALGFYSLYEPINVVVLPVLAVLLGVVSRPRNSQPPQPTRKSERSLSAPWLHAAVGVVLSISTVLATLALAQNITFRWAMDHQSVAGLRAAAAMVPWRTEPRWWIARSSDPGTANQMTADLVRDNPWDTEIRLTAAWVAQATGEPDLANRYLDEQLQMFPGDKIGIDTVVQGRWPP